LVCRLVFVSLFLASCCFAVQAPNFTPASSSELFKYEQDTVSISSSGAAWICYRFDQRSLVCGSSSNRCPGGNQFSIDSGSGPIQFYPSTAFDISAIGCSAAGSPSSPASASFTISPYNIAPSCSIYSDGCPDANARCMGNFDDTMYQYLDSSSECENQAASHLQIPSSEYPFDDIGADSDYPKGCYLLRYKLVGQSLSKRLLFNPHNAAHGLNGPSDSKRNRRVICKLHSPAPFVANGICLAFKIDDTCQLALCNPGYVNDPSDPGICSQTSWVTTEISESQHRNLSENYIHNH